METISKILFATDKAIIRTISASL